MERDSAHACPCNQRCMVAGVAVGCGLLMRHLIHLFYGVNRIRCTAHSSSLDECGLSQTLVLKS